MKCPKCNYISFDYNQACPRCNKDISIDQEKLNIPAFKPNPPSLLGTLLGDGAQSEAQPRGSDRMETAHREHLQEATVRLDEPFLNDSQEIDLGSELQEEGGEFELEAAAGEPGQESEAESLLDGAAVERKFVPQQKSEIEGTICLEESEVFPGQETKQEEFAEISLDLEEISLDSGEQAETAPTAGKADDSLEFDLGDFSLEDAGAETTLPSAEVSGVDAPDQGTGPGKEEKVSEPEADEVMLTMDDLKVNETGELEIGKLVSDISEESKPVATDAPDPGAQDPAAAQGEGEDDLSLLLGDDAIEIPAASQSVDSAESLDLENLDLELDLEGPEQKKI